MPEQIAVGVDGTGAARVALEWAVARSQNDACSLVLIHAAGNARSTDETSDSLAQSELEFVREHAPSTPVTFEIHHGEAVKVLAQEASRFTLVVVGTHKTGFLRGRAFGSTSLRLASALPVPLAVIPGSFGGSRHGVIVGIDDGPKSLMALRLGAAEALRSRSTLTLIHASSNSQESPIANALELMRNEYPGIEPRVREVAGHPGEVLVNAAATAEVLYLGVQYGDAGLGPVGYDVLFNISGPTILVPFERELADLPH